MGDFKDAYRPISSADLGKGPDYAQSVNPQTVLKDPRFLKDLREEYESRGNFNLSDDDLVKKFYSDRSWAELNTLGAAQDAYEAVTSNADRKARMARIQDVYDQLPFFWQSGGRGLSAVPDIAVGLLADPINAIPGLNAASKGAMAARAARAGGQAAEQAIKAGTKAGIVSGAVSEGAINAGQDVAVDLLQQKRDIELGRQDGYEAGRTIASAAISGGIGAGLGGAIGGFTGRAASERGIREADTLTGFFQRSADEAATMPQKQVDQFMAREDYGPFAPQRAEEPPPPPDAPEEDPFKVKLREQTKAVNETYEGLQTEYDRLRKEKAPEDEIADAKRALDGTAALRETATRLEKEEAEIRALEGSNDPKKLDEARRRRARFEQDYSDFRILSERVMRGQEEPAAPPAAQQIEAPTPTQAAPTDAVTAEGRPALEAPTEPSNGPTYGTINQAGPEQPVVTPAPRQTPEGGFEVAATMPNEVTPTEAVTTEAPDLKPKRRGKKNTEETAAPVSEENVGGTVEPTPVAAYTRPELRAQLIAEGIDPSTIVPSSKKGKVLPRDVKAAIAARDANAGPDAYATTIQTDLANYLDRAATLGAGEDAALTRQVVELMARGENKNVDDILGLYDFVTKFDADMQSGVQSKIVDFNNTEKKRINNIISANMARNPALTREEATLLAQAEVLGQRAEPKVKNIPTDAAGKPIQPGLFASNANRLGVSGKIEQASIFTTAGRGFNSQRIAEVLRRGMASERVPSASVEEFYRGAGDTVASRTVKGFGLERGETAFPSKVTMARDEAFIRARENHRLGVTINEAIEKLAGLQSRYTDLVAAGKEKAAARLQKEIDALKPVVDRGYAPQIVPYVSERVETIRGKEYPKGTTLWVDGASGRSYASMEDAMQARGDYKIAPDRAPETRAAAPVEEPTPVRSTEENRTETLKQLLAQYAGDPVAFMRAAEALVTKTDAVASPKLAEAAAITGKKGDRLLIVRSKLDPNDVRMMNPKQADAGKDIRAIINKEGPGSDPANWEIRYAPASEFSYNPTQRRAAFDRASVDPDATPNNAPGIRRTVGDATGEGRPLTADEFGQIVVRDLTEDEVNAIAFATGYDPRAIREAGKSGKLSGGYIVQSINKMEYGQKALPQTIEAFNTMVKHLETLCAMQARIAPQGFILPQADRVAARETLTSLLSGYDADTVAQATKFLERLGGDPTRAPTFDAGNGWSHISKWNQDSVTIPGVSQQRGTIIPIAKLYHEVFHWAYRNILTPEDRLEFWSAMRKYYDGKTGLLDMDTLSARVPLENGSGALNSLDNFQEFAANQFSMWATRGKSAGVFETPTYWNRMANYVKAVFERYFFKAPIDPDLEPLFAKVLPDDQRIRFQEGRGLKGQHFGERQKYVETINFRYQELQAIKNDLHTAMRADEAGNIITAFEQLRGYLAGVASGQNVKGTLSVLKPLDKMIRDRLLDINEIMSGRAIDTRSVDAVKGLAAADLETSARVMSDPERVADLLVDLYDNGHAGDFKPTSGRGGNIDFTPLSKLVEMIEDKLENSFVRETQRLPNAALPDQSVRTASSKEEVRANRRVRQAVNAKVAQEEAVTKQAEVIARTPRSKRERSATGPQTAIDPAVAASPKDMSIAQLAKEFEINKGTARGDQLALELLNKQRAKPGPAKAVAIPREILTAKAPELEQRFMEAMREGGPANKKLIDQITYELQRRASNAARKKDGLPPLKPIISKVQDAVSREINDNVGLASDDAIPPSARANVREAISYITHRDPEVQYTARTMLYRMMNLMGKTVRDTLGDTNIFSAHDVYRLAGEDPISVSTGVFADFRSPEFKNLRGDLRRMAIGLTKGISTPFDAVHEIGHMITRGVLDEEDLSTISRYYSQADDKIKRRIENQYGKHPRYADMSQQAFDDVMAEEWFAESLANYLGERVARGDMFEISGSGRMTEINLRGKLDMLVDRATEYIAYVVNGLIGRNDIKQEFRRLMFYGDMFTKKRPTTLADAFGDMVGVPQHLAADYVRETMMMAPKTKLARIREFIGNGVGMTPDGEPRAFYHATPNGTKLRKETAPDAILKPSMTGKHGPGVYVTDNPSVAEQIYTKANKLSLVRQIDQADLPEAVSRDLYQIVSSILPEVRGNLDRINRGIEYLKLDLGKQTDEIGREVLIADLQAMKSQAAALAQREAAILKTLAQKDIVVDELVLPLYVRALNTADFSRQARYWEDDPFIASIVEYVTKRDLAEPEEVRKFLDLLTGREVDGAPGVRGSDVWEEMVTLFGSPDRVTAALNDLGYDSLKATHINEINQNGDFGAVAHTVLNVFDPSNVKHVEADYFDYNDARLYFRDFDGEAKGLSSDLVRGLMTNDIERLDTTSPLPTLEQLEAQGISSPVIDAVASIWRKRPLTEREEQAVRKVGIGGLIMSQSNRMRAVGADWMAKRYEDFFPMVYQLFGKKFFPLRDALLKLPDASNGIGMWFRRATGGALEQPKSYTRIVKALRYGEGSRQEKLLSPQEREVWKSIRSSFRAAFDEMRQAGVIMGDRGFNYFPQVWSAQKIEKDKVGFLNAMVRYYETERAANGLPFDQNEANKFAEGLYAKFTDDADTAYFPIHASRRNATSDNIDYSRIIELDKYPGMIAELEPYLESNLEALLVKYHEGAARRLHQTRTWGVNSHGFFDYMHVADQGIDGIARLLSSNKEFRKDIRSITPDGYVDVSTLRDVVKAPFEEDYTAAKDFASRLVEVYATKGEGAARQMLQTVAPKTDRGLAIPAFTARSEAILGAIRDYGGIGGKVEAKEFDLMEDALRVSLKQPLTAPAYGGETALKASRVLRQFNSLTLLGFTTLTSFSDLALPIIRSGEFKAWYNGLRQLAQDPDYARLIRQTGVAAESIVHENMSNLFGGQSARVTNAFFNITMLTPWTEMNRKIAGATGYETFKVMQDRAFRYFVDGKPITEQPYQYKQAHRFLSQYGLADYLPTGQKGTMSLADRALLESDDTVRMAIIKFADQAIFQPNANDIPLWAQTPVGALIFQLKSYPLMMARLGKEVLVNDIKALWKGEGGDPRRAMYFLALGPAFGMGALGLKDIIQSRGGEENNSPELRKRNILKVLGYDKEVHGDENDFLGWYAEGFMTMGGLGLLFEMIHDIAAQVDNGAYGKVRVTSTILGPSAGTMFSAMDVAAGVFDSGENSNAKERSAVREAVSRIPIAGQVKGFREKVVDALAGEQEARGGGSTGGWSSSWGKGWQ